MNRTGQRRSLSRGAAWVSLIGALLSVSLLSSSGQAQTKPALVTHLDARAATYEERGRFDLRQEFSLGLEARGLVRSNAERVGYAPGFGGQLGSSLPASFVYDFQLYPAGVGLALGNSGFIAVAGGGRFSGATGLVPASGAAATEARVELGLPGACHASLWFAPSWQGNHERRAGTLTFSFADELSSGVALRIGSETDSFGANLGGGLLVGVQYFERGGARGVGLVLGLGVDAFVH